MKFEKAKMQSRYWTYRKYLSARCESLARTIEKKTGLNTIHIESNQRGMSNYIELTSDEMDEIIKIRISDHDNNEAYHDEKLSIYIQDMTWNDIKKEVLEFVLDLKKIYHE